MQNLKPLVSSLNGPSVSTHMRSSGYDAVSIDILNVTFFLRGTFFDWHARH